MIVGIEAIIAPKETPQAAFIAAAPSTRVCGVWV